MPIITAKGLVTIPREIRDHLGVGPGSKIDFLVVGDRVVIRPATCLSAQAPNKPPPPPSGTGLQVTPTPALIGRA